MKGVIRRDRVRLGTVAQAAHYAEKGFLPILGDIPGFVSCHLLDAGNDVLAVVALFDSAEGTSAAIRASTDWFRDEWSSFRPLPPEVVAAARLPPPPPSRRPRLQR